MRPALPAALFAIALFIAMVFTSSCQPPRIDPPLILRPTAMQAFLEASIHARDLHLDTHAPGAAGTIYNVQDTHSMEPVLIGGDWIVVDRTVRLKDVRVGQIVVYMAQWRPGNATPVCHRIASREADGRLIVSGDNVRPEIDAQGRNRRSEASYRVDEENLVGVVIERYRVDPKA